MTTINGLSSDIILGEMTAPVHSANMIYHRLPAQNKGVKYFKGYDSFTATIQGYIPRDDALRAELMALVGTQITVTDEEWNNGQPKLWWLDSCPFDRGTAIIRFTMNLTEV